MKYCLRLSAFLLALILLVFPLPARAASSTAVTGSFDSSDLTGSDFSGQNLELSEFTNVILEGADLSNAKLGGVVFNGSSVNNANLHGADLTNGLAYLTSFRGSDLTDAIFLEAIMLRCTFDGADITGADFSFAVLDGDQVKKLCANASGVNSKTGVDTRESLMCK